MIKAIFFDIDGTLISMKTRCFEKSLQEDLLMLKKKGVKLFIASGRPPVQLPLLGKDFNAFPWSGMILLNGQYCLDENGEVYHKNPISKEAVKTLVPYLLKTKIPCTFYELDYAYSNADIPHLRAYLTSINKLEDLPPIEDLSRAFDHDIYQVCPSMPPEQDAEFVAHAEGIKSVRWTDDFADMIPADGGKPEGIEVTLKKYGLKKEECMAFGDGQNDAEMLKYVGIGVAMGNARDEVKAYADYVTEDCEDMGVSKALRHFGLL